MNVESIKARLKGIDYRHYVALGITLLFVLLGAFVYRNSYVRFYETCRDLIGSVIQYFKFIMGEDVSSDVTVLTQSVITYPLEIAFEEFKLFFVEFGNAFVNFDNFKDYLGLLFKIFFFVSTLGGVVILLLYILYSIFHNVLYSEKDKYPFEFSKPLELALAFGKNVYRPCKAWILSFYGFIRENYVYWKLWAVIWILSLNVASIVIAFLSYFLYFAVSYNVGSIFFQFYKLILDLSLMFGGLPVIAWLMIALLIYVRWSLKVGKARIQRIEGLCEKFVSGLKSVVVFFVGTMGKGKTKLMTDISLTQRNLFRDKAFEILSNKDLSFPDFPWVRVERFVLLYMELGVIAKPLDIAREIDRVFLRLDRFESIKKYIDRHNRRHENKVTYASCLPFGYDFFNDKVEYDNGLYFQALREVIVEYAQAFFVYVCDNLNVGNYSIRFDDELQTLGNFPLWDYDFINKKSTTFDYLSRYSHILDFDMMRLSRKVREDSSNGLLTSGIITITEVGKERGNQLELQGVKKDDKNANQKNDGFNKYLKFVRHLATISYFPFIKVFVDDQRPESWGADGKDLTQIVRIGDEEETRCALPFFGPVDGFCTKILKKHRESYYKYRFYREDRTLLTYLLKTFASKVYNFWEYCHNRFDYTPVNLTLCDGTQEGDFNQVVYYEAKVKDFSKRYSTDCYSPIFSKVPSLGINFIPEYSSINMTPQEFEYQNSYLYQDLDGISQGGNDGK